MHIQSSLKFFKCYQPVPLQQSNACEKCGIPERIVTDNATNFTSAEFSYFLKQNGIKQTSAPYHPTSNGLAERAVKIFKTGIKKMTEGSLRQKLSRFLFNYRRTPQSTTG